MARTETARQDRRAQGSALAAYPTRRFSPSAARPHAEAETMLRELAFVFQATRVVRQSMNRRDVP